MEQDENVPLPEPELEVEVQESARGTNPPTTDPMVEVRTDVSQPENEHDPKPTPTPTTDQPPSTTAPGAPPHDRPPRHFPHHTLPHHRPPFQQQPYFRPPPHQYPPPSTGPFGGPPPGFAPPPARPLLPPGWTEHRAPQGQIYWYNATTGQSTWERPPMPPLAHLMALGTMGGPPPGLGGPPGVGGQPGIRPPGGFGGGPQMGQGIQQQQQAPPQQQKVKEKKKEKANAKKPIPGTLWQLVTTTEGHEFFFNKETKKSVWEAPEEVVEPLRKMREEEAALSNKRKLEGGDDESEGKRQKADEGDTQAAAAGGGAEGTELTEDDIAWQLQFMDEDEREKLGIDDEDQKSSRDGRSQSPEVKEQGQASGTKLNSNSELLEDERVEQFTQLLREKDISPFATWEKELPKIIGDHRYTLIKSLKQRKDLFDNFCRVLIAEKRAEKKNKPAPKDLYQELLGAEATHRSHWDDFKHKFRKDARFTSVSDAKERERLFRDHVQVLRDRRAADEKRAEDEYLELLRETREIRPDSSWRVTKKLLERDLRYDAVKSSTRREDIFRDYLEKLEERKGKEGGEKERKEREKKAREEGSLRERERQVRRERAQRSRETDHSKSAAQREEGLLAFNTLLIDRIRTHSVTWADKRADLERDTRFHSAGLYEADRRQLFDEHVDKLHRTRVDQFHRLLDEHVRLDTTWLEVLPVVRDDPRATRLSRDEDALEKVFDAYMVERVKTAKKEFEELLRENQFVEFRVRWVGMGGGGAAAPGEEGEDTEPRVVPKLDLKEIHAVLKEDKRYLVLNHLPEERDRMIEDYLGTLEKQKQITSVHVGRS